MTTLNLFPISAPGSRDRPRAGAPLVRGTARTHPATRGYGRRRLVSLRGETWLYLYATPSAGTAKNTIAGWEVKDMESVMAGLRERGVVFEQYDLGDVQMVDGLADFGIARAAWFKDSEGSTYEMTEVRHDP